MIKSVKTITFKLFDTPRIPLTDAQFSTNTYPGERKYNSMEWFAETIMFLIGSSILNET